MDGSVPIACYNPYFLSLWVGANRYAGEAVNLLGAVNTFFLGLLSLWGWVFTGTSNVTQIVPATLLTSGINLVASLVFTKWLGLSGPLWGTLAGFMVSICWILLLLRRTLGTSLRSLSWAFLKPLIFAIPYSCCLGWISRNHTPWGWIGLGVEIISGALCYLAIAWLLILESAERDRWNDRIKPILHFIFERLFKRILKR